MKHKYLILEENNFAEAILKGWNRFYAINGLFPLQVLLTRKTRHYKNSYCVGQMWFLSVT